MPMLERVFDKRSKQAEAELASFQQELQSFAARMAPATLLTQSRREGPLLRVRVLAVEVRSSTAPSASWVERWRP